MSLLQLNWPFCSFPHWEGLVADVRLFAVTLLAVLAARAIALPLSPAFPATELRYILNQSGASLLVSSDKFAGKASEVLEEELEKRPAHLRLEKHLGGGAHEKVVVGDEDAGRAAMMLYTSGTTNRPVD